MRTRPEQNRCRAKDTIQQMRFVPSDHAFSNLATLEGYLREHSKPVAFYSEKHSAFSFVKADAKSWHPTTLLGRGLLELNGEIQFQALTAQAPAFAPP
jgi:hypothetical protein